MPRLATCCLPNSFTEIWWKWADFHITEHTWSPLCLTRQGRDKLTAIFQTTFSNIFSSVRIYEYCFVFTEVCSFGSNWQYPSIVAWSVPSHCLNQWCLVYWRLYASLSFSELKASLLFYYDISYKESRLHAWKKQFCKVFILKEEYQRYKIIGKTRLCIYHIKKPKNHQKTSYQTYRLNIIWK